MPRIDPFSLLKCLSVLLGPTGGIKSKEEVHRLANLMTKFSKKLVSKCIYIQILKTTETELLSQFMTAGGWNLIHMWLSDGILTKNWALVLELLDLLLLCPVDIERLKSNNCPKLVKGLSKEAKDLNVRASANKLVEQWLKIVKGEVAPNSVPAHVDTEIMLPPQQNLHTTPQSQINEEERKNIETESSEIETTVKIQDLEMTNNCVTMIDTNQQFQEKLHIQPVQYQIVSKTLPGQSQPTQIKQQSFVVVSSNSQHQPAVPVYKITIRDGKQVLTKVETEVTNITSIFNKDSVNNVEINGSIKEDSLTNCQGEDNLSCRKLDEGADSVSSEVKETNCNDNNVIVKNINAIDDEKDGKDSNSDVNKSSDKENRDFRKKDDKSSISSEKKSSSSSHHNSSSSSSRNKHSSSSSSSRSSSSSHRSSSHRSGTSSSKSSSSSSKSSKDRDKHHSSSSKHSSSSSSSSKNKSDKDKDKEKEKQKKDQAEKDKATLEKIQGQTLSTKFGKIPKKKAEDEKLDSTALRKSSTDSRDSSKENKDTKKATLSSPGVLDKKNISISIENRKNSHDSSRPKTVKTFNSKFRSTGLEEEVKPPPPRSAAKKSSSQSGEKKIPPPKLPLKRTSPLRETAVSDKRAKLSLEPPATDDKKGAIKLIAPKPKPMVLQESDMFMDALMTASTKSKEPRKRKRRTSLSKDGPNDSKKSDSLNSNELEGRDVSPPPSSSPQSADEKLILAVKPDLKFYQDTLETDEDKDKSLEEDELSAERDKNRIGSDEDDERSRTPTCDDDSRDAKAPLSPDEFEETRKVPSSPNSEIRYVDGLRSVLLLQKRKGPKKALKWKTELESIRYFELDETERVNVTKTFTDMKQMEKQNEREAFQMARKLSTEDLMEEKTMWKPLIPIDLTPALVEPGKDSKEKEIQYAREKGILQALYFNRSMIPDSAAEPDEERHHVMTDPRTIPLDDLTGNKESEKDFTLMPWPEPKPSLVLQAPVVPNIHFSSFPQQNPVGLGMPPIQAMSIQPIPQGIMQMNTMPDVTPVGLGGASVSSGGVGGGCSNSGGGGGWRTGDGKVIVPDINIGGMSGPMPGTFPGGGMDPTMMPPTMMPPPGIYNQQEGFSGMIPNEENSFGHMQNNFQGPGMFPPNFRGGPMIGNRGRGGGPGWFRGGAVGPMRGGGWNARGNWRGNGKQPIVCRQFTKNGFCRVGEKCQYLHPGVNCPPF